MDNKSNLKLSEDMDVRFEVLHTLEDIISKIQENESKTEVRITISKECNDLPSDNFRLSKKLCFLCEDYEDKERGSYLFSKVCEIFIHPLERFLERREHNYIKSSVMNIIGYNEYVKINFILDVILFVFSTMYDTYRTAVSVFLIIFVQQNCGSETCGLFENVFKGNKLNDAVFFFSLITFIFYLLLNLAETNRESLLKSCFTITKTSPGIIGISDSQRHEVNELENLIKTQNNLTKDDKIRELLGNKHPIYNNEFTSYIKMLLQHQYQELRLQGSIFFGLYFINLLLSSSIILINNSNNQKTYFGLITNTVIFLPRLYDIFTFMMMDKYDTTSTFVKTYAKYNNYNENAFNIIQNEVLRHGIYYLIGRKYVDENKNGFYQDKDLEKFGNYKKYSKMMRKRNW